MELGITGRRAAVAAATGRTLANNDDGVAVVIEQFLSRLR